MEQMFTIEHFTLKKCLTDTETVTVPYGIKAIAEDAFAGCRTLIRVHIPDTVERIGTRAFEACIHLREINIPEHFLFLKMLG